jgi:hypothetical protein
MTSCCIPQLPFSFYRHRAMRADCSGGQITSDAGLLPLRDFDERHHLTRDWAALLGDPRREESFRHDALASLRQRLYQIVAGYEDANDADRLRHDPALQIVADQKLGEPLGSQTTFSRWENAPSSAQPGASERCALGSVHSSRWPAGPPAPRDFAGHRFHRRSRARPAAIQFLQRRLRAAHVPSHADFRASHRLLAERAFASQKHGKKPITVSFERGFDAGN